MSEDQDCHTIAETSTRIPKLTSSVHDIAAEKPPFGSRFLTDQSDVWTQNAWDHVPPPEDQTEAIFASLARQRVAPVPGSDREKYNAKPAKYWDNFYKANAGNFFRDRKWLHLEFPELLTAAQSDAGDVTICEIGCGAGNTAFPLLSANKNPKLMIRAFDYSSHAVKLVQANSLYQDPPVGSIQAAVWDLSCENSLPPGVAPESVDIVVLVFVLSALHPDEWEKAVRNIHRMLKPGGVVLLRDYGRYDLTQLRFKSGRLLEDNFYIRGDKTRVYFFELGRWRSHDCSPLLLFTLTFTDELALIFTGTRPTSAQKTCNTVQIAEESRDDSYNGSLTLFAHSESRDDQISRDLPPLPGVEIHPTLLRPHVPHPPSPPFSIEQLGVDRRLLVNRRRQLKMYRVWVQGKFRKSPID
ncbi:S-adenosyl-L-methionine-dependent methyltransferase [Pisolithus thermaeus]|nr:S-adenosyl-L-methionine-dependent methyltransferase [Pisolithus thermaeus]